MIEKLRTAVWFAQRPSHWQHAVALAVRKVLPDHDSTASRAAAGVWAAKRAVPVAEALSIVGIKGETRGLTPALVAEGTKRATRSAIQMGGPGDLDLLADAVRLTAARK